MPPRFQSLAFLLVFVSDSKSTNFKLFSLTTAEVFALAKANCEKKKKNPKTTRNQTNQTQTQQKQKGKFSYISGISQGKCSL